MRESEARRTIEPVLEPGEAVLWCGTPVTARVVMRKVGTLLFGLSIAGYATYSLLGSSGGPEGTGFGNLARSLVQHASADPHLLIPAAVLAALPLGLLTLLALNRRRLRRTAYAITNGRLLAVVGPRGKIAWSLTPESVAYVQVRRLGERMASVSFNRSRYRRGRGYGNLNRLYTFERLVDADRVADRVGSWLEECEAAAIEDARTVRRIVQPDFGLRIEVPTSWKEESPGEDDSAFDVLSSGRGLGGETESSEKLLVLKGPLGASFALEAAPAGTWTLERARDTLHRLGWMLSVVDETTQMTVGSVSGFSITYEMGLGQILGSLAADGRGAGVRMKFVVLEPGDMQVRFALGWITRFPRLQEPLEAIVRSFEAPGAAAAY